MESKPDISFETVPFKVTHPERIPAQRYYDEAFFRLENERFWPRVWQLACRLEEIAEVGDWVEYEILEKSVLVVRTGAGETDVKAFHNVCRHRGVKLGTGHGNAKQQGLTCPFHGWRWNVEGKNTFVLGCHLFSVENLEPADLDLKTVRVDFWGGCAFINFDHDAPPLLDTIKPLDERLQGRKVEKLRVEWWHSAILPTNWKLAMEAFMEGYHVMRTHPQLHKTMLPGFDQYARPASPETFAAGISTLKPAEMVEQMIVYNATLSDGMAGMVHANDVAVARDIQHKVDLPEDPVMAFMEWSRLLNEAITQRNLERGVDFPDLNALAANGPTSPVQYLFPHYFMLPMFGNMSAYRIRPLSAETCLFEIWSLVLFPEGEKRPRPVAPIPKAHDDPSFPMIPQQDYSNLPLQQRGLHNGGFEYMRLARSVEGMISNYQRTIDGFLGGLPADRLVQAMQVSSGVLDDSIKDLGL